MFGAMFTRESDVIMCAVRTARPELVVPSLQTTYVKYKMEFKLLYAGSEACFGWDPRHLRDVFWLGPST